MEKQIKRLPPPSKAALLFWKDRDKVDALRQCLAAATGDKARGASRSALVEVASVLAPDEQALDDALGRFTRDKRSMQPDKYHVFVFALYFAFQNYLSPAPKEAVAQKVRNNRLFQRYEEWLRSSGDDVAFSDLIPPSFSSPAIDVCATIAAPPTVGSNTSVSTDSNEGATPFETRELSAPIRPVVEKLGLQAVGPIHGVLNLLNIERAMHQPANARLFGTPPHENRARIHS